MTHPYPAILDTLGRGAPVRIDGVDGGCIADAAVAAFADGFRVFVKRVAGAPGMFEAEAEGLRALAAAGAIRVPQVLAVGADSLVLELVDRRDEVVPAQFAAEPATPYDCLIGERIWERLRDDWYNP